MMSEGMVGRTVGRYRIDQRLGQGGTGVVYRAHDLRLGRPVALKLLNKELHDVPAAWGQLLAEAQTACSLNHPNICTVYEAGEEDGEGYISMEYVQGEPLNVAALPRGLPPETVARYGVQIAEALEHAHEQGIVHGDVKSANVMITPQGRIKVLDFGLARRLGPEDLSVATTSSASLNEIGPIAGTLPYLAPEILRGRPATAGTDLWGTGVILHEIATGELPFKGNTAFELSLVIMVDSRVSFPRVPAELRPIVERCLEKDPARRYQHARDLREDLQKQNAAPRGLHRVMPARYRRLKLAAVGLALVAGLSLAIVAARDVYIRHAVASAGPAIPEHMVLTVVPFRVLGDQQQSLNYIAEGLTEFLSARLSQIPSLSVIPFADLQQGARSKPVEDAARNAGANMAATGVVQSAGDQIRVVVTLKNLRSRKQVWAQEYSGSQKDTLSIEDRVFSSVATALNLPADRAAGVSAAPAPTENADAYDFYLHGRDAIHGFKDSNDILQAIGFFDKALKQDPGFALAYAGLADASLEMYAQRSESFWAEKALHAAQEAVRLNPRLPEAHFALGSVYSATGHPVDAVAELRRALDLQPKSDDGYRRLGTALLATGRTDEAFAAYQKAIQLNPYDPDHYQMLGAAYLEVGENEKAVAAYRRVTELEPDNAAGYIGMGAAHFQGDQWSACIPEFQKALQLQPAWDTYSNLGLAYFYLRQYDEAVKMFEKAVELNPTATVAEGNLADAYRWAGQKEKAAAAYQRAIESTNRKLQVNPRDASAMGSLALYYAKTGDTSQALALARRAREINPSDVELMYTSAAVNALAGNREAALDSLKLALAKGYSIREAASDPELASLQSLPQFAKLMQRYTAGTTSAN